jgi:hypothetical protein
MTLQKLFQVHDGVVPPATIRETDFDLTVLFDSGFLSPTADRHNVTLTAAGIAAAAGIASSGVKIVIAGQSGAFGTVASLAPPLPIV